MSPSQNKTMRAGFSQREGPFPSIETKEEPFTSVDERHFAFVTPASRSGRMNPTPQKAAGIMAGRILPRQLLLRSRLTDGFATKFSYRRRPDCARTVFALIGVGGVFISLGFCNNSPIR